MPRPSALTSESEVAKSGFKRQQSGMRGAQEAPESNSANTVPTAAVRPIARSTGVPLVASADAEMKVARLATARDNSINPRSA